MPQHKKHKIDPHPFQIEASAVEMEIQAGEDGGVKLPTFQGTAYTGGTMRLEGFRYPVVVDLSSTQAAAPAIPSLFAHDNERIVGHGTAEISAQRIKISGVVSHDGPDAQRVVASSKNGFPWQMSIGASPGQIDFVESGKSIKVNGKNFNGPVYVARQNVLGEISFVPRGADSNTSVNVAASAINNKGFDMNFETWLEAKGFAVADLNEGQKNTLKAAFDAEQEIEAAKAKNVDTPEGSAAFAKDPVAEMRAAAAAESNRIAAINKTCKDNPELQAKALSEGWTPEKAELEVLRASYSKAPAAHVHSAQTFTPRVVEAAACQSLGLKSAEKQFTDQELQAAHTAYRGRMGLQQLIVEAAAANGFSGGPWAIRSNLREVLRAAFSTLSLPGILSNSANKFLLESFMTVEQVWRQIAAIRTGNDFKTMTRYRLTGSMQYDKVGNGGKLTHGTTGEESYTNKIETYGKMYAITRQDIINDDLSALSSIPQKLGRGGALAINDAFWTAFLDNSSFFASGNNNYFEGSSTNLQSSSLKTAVQKFRKQVDADGKPLAVAPKFLLVPPEVEVDADELYTSTNLNSGGSSTTAKIPNRNVFAGKYQPIVSAYLSNSSYTGYSALAWYLLADPMDIPVIEMAFLNGQETPIVEQADADFDTLGIQMRGYHDWGVAKQDYRGGVKSKGEA